MADNVQAAVCTKCGGSLRYDKEIKRWRCRYCGQYIEYYNSENTDVDGIARQVIEDVAYRRMDSAEKNLSDCTRKNQKSVATQIATLSYNLGRFANATDERERNDYMDRFKSYFKTFINDYPTIGAEETSFYNSFDNNAADVFANLINLFSLFGQYGESRVKFISEQMSLDQVYSKEENASLLRVAIKNRNIQNIKKILNNDAHIDKVEACVMLMGEYPDDDSKGELISMVFDRTVADSINKNIYAKYFGGGDSIKTKIVVLTGLIRFGIAFDAMQIFGQMVNSAKDIEDIREIIAAFYSDRLDSRKDNEIFHFLMTTEGLGALVGWYIKLLAEKDIYMPMNSRIICEIMDEDKIPSAEKIEALIAVFNDDHFSVENRAKDVAIAHYMCEVADDFEVRRAFLSEVLKPGFLSNRTVTRYVNETTIDGAGKVEILGLIFNAGFQVSFARNLLSDYMNSGRDSQDVKSAVYNSLVNEGYSVNSSDFGSFLLGDTELSEKLAKARQMLNNGSKVPSDTLMKYIKSVPPERPQEFSLELFNIMAQGEFDIDGETIIKYVLYCYDPDRARNLLKMLQRAGGAPMSSVPIYFGTTPVHMNLVQAYMMITGDVYEIASQCVDMLMQFGLNANDKIQDFTGSKIPFDRFVAQNASVLSNTTLRLAEEHKKQGFFR